MSITLVIAATNAGWRSLEREKFVAADLRQDSLLAVEPLCRRFWRSKLDALHESGAVNFAYYFISGSDG